MNFNLAQSIEILERTPDVLDAMLHNLSEAWTTCNEGGDTWSAFDIVGHLVHGEKTDWISRMEIMLSDEGDQTLKPFDRFAQFADSKGKTLSQLLDEFRTLRQNNLNTLRSKNLTEAHFSKTAIHPEFGPVTLRQHLSTWTAHDLGHIAQIARVMAKQYKEETGPWIAYLRILNL